MNAIDRFRLDGKVALITGGSKGLGRSMAEGLASAGADLVLCSRHEDEVAEVADSVARDFGRQAIGVRCDVTQGEDVEALVERAIADMEKIDILINNAGINIRGPIEELEPEQFEEVMRVNVSGPWLLCRAVAPHMKRARYGRVINMSSTLGAVGVPGRTPYASSKGAVTLMTRVLALEWASFGITVNAICPGPFLTPMNLPIAETEDTKKFILGAVPLARWGELHEIQGAAIFLGSDAASYVTGTMLFVDGGWTAH
ncbi:MAG: glucose 1-dehydrogenase [Planctomycetota bacterium]|nr:glucose 1-dehydrogenase [Planctomycetota bacterium]